MMYIDTRTPCSCYQCKSNRIIRSRLQDAEVRRDTVDQTQRALDPDAASREQSDRWGLDDRMSDVADGPELGRMWTATP